MCSLAVCVVLLPLSARGQTSGSAQGQTSDAALPPAPTPQTAGSAAAGDDGRQTKRILGIIPNFRSVSADVQLPPLSAKQKFGLFAQDSFDYTAFEYVAIVTAVAQAEGSYPEFHTGAPAYGRYYWHEFADNTDGNLMTESLMPIVTHEDPRYYTLGRGGLFKRTAYSVSRLLVTRNDDGGRTANFSEVVGNGAASGISNFYYPSRERTWTKTGQRWVAQIGLDGFSNLVKEFWPDVNKKIFHGKQ